MYKNLELPLIKSSSVTAKSLSFISQNEHFTVLSTHNNNTVIIRGINLHKNIQICLHGWWVLFGEEVKTFPYIHLADKVKMIYLFQLQV